jgi:hypothetical protein
MLSSSMQERLVLPIAGVYGMSSLATMTWGVPTFIIGMFRLDRSGTRRRF